MNDIERLVTQSHYKPSKKKELIDKLLNEKVFTFGTLINDDPKNINLNLLETETQSFVPIFLDEQMCLEVCPEEIGVITLYGVELLASIFDNKVDVVVHPEIDDYLIIKQNEIKEILGL